jgi:hypothetical protein
MQMEMRERGDESPEFEPEFSAQNASVPTEYNPSSVRRETEREIQEWVDQFDYGLFNPVFKVAAKIQKALGLY